MPLKPDFTHVDPNPSLDAFRRSVAELVLEGRVVGYLATQVGAVADVRGGRLWWTRWSEPWEVVEWLVTRIDEDSPLPEYDDGIDFTGDAAEEFRSGTIAYLDHLDPERRLSINYSLRWLDGNAVEALWDRYGFGDSTLL